MTLRIFAIYDIKAEMYNSPFFFVSRGQAIRAFKDLANDAQSMIGKHPGDFKLVEIGLFDDNSGAISGIDHQGYGFGSDYRDLPNGILIGAAPGSAS